MYNLNKVYKCCQRINRLFWIKHLIIINITKMCGTMLPTLQGLIIILYTTVYDVQCDNNCLCLSVSLYVLQMRHRRPFYIIFSRMNDRDGLFFWNKGQIYAQSWETEIIFPSRAKVKLLTAHYKWFGFPKFRGPHL